MFKLCKIKCAPKKGQTKARPKGWKRGFFSKGWRQLWVTVTRAEHRGGIQRRIRPSTWQSWQRCKKASRNWHFSPLKISKDALRESGKSSCAKKKRTWNINDIDLHPCHGKGKNSVCFQSITYFLYSFFFECILAVGHLHGDASELPPFDSQILRVLANNRE